MEPIIRHGEPLVIMRGRRFFIENEGLSNLLYKFVNTQNVPTLYFKAFVKDDMEVSGSKL